MKTEIFFIIITLLIILIIFLAYVYYQQKIINTYLRREIKIRGYIQSLKQLIFKRHLFLDNYDFQRCNLDESLLKQDEVGF